MRGLRDWAGSANGGLERRLTDVVILNDYASMTGGSTGVALASTLELARRGVRVTFVSCVGPVDPRLEGVANVCVMCLGQAEIGRDGNRLRAMWLGLRNATGVRAVRAALADKDPSTTIVHAHTWMKALSPFALEAATALGFRLVVTLHDFFIVCPNGGFFDHGTGEHCDRRPMTAACLRCQCDRSHAAHKVWRTARTALQNGWLKVPESVSYYVGVSDYSLQVAQRHLPESVPAGVVRNPVDAPWVGRAAVGGNEAFVFVGRFEIEKGVLVFAEAVRRTGLRAVFVGDGTLREKIEGLCPEARFTGWLSAAEIRRELLGARALVFPPLWHETLGLVVIEAAAAGVPAIVAAPSAATDTIRDDETGLAFARGSVDSLAMAMQRVADDDALVERLGRAAYDWYWDDPWTTASHVDELSSVYASVLGRAEQFSPGGLGVMEAQLAEVT